MKLLSLDQSLNNTGFCVFDDMKLLQKGVIQPKIMGVERLNMIRQEVNSLIDKYSIDLIGIEGYSFGSNGMAVFNIGELGGVLRLLFYDRLIKYIVVPPTTVKKFLTGKGNSKKDLMLKEVYKRYDFNEDNDNIADAYVIGRFILAVEGLDGDINKSQQEIIGKFKKDQDGRQKMVKNENEAN